MVNFIFNMYFRNVCKLLVLIISYVDIFILYLKLILVNRLLMSRDLLVMIVLLRII